MIRFCHRVISQRSTLYTRTVESDRLPNVDKVMETNGHVYTPNLVPDTKESDPVQSGTRPAGPGDGSRPNQLTRWSLPSKLVSACQ